MNNILWLSCACGEELQVKVHVFHGLMGTEWSPPELPCVSDPEIIAQTCTCSVDSETLIEQAEEFLSEEQWDDGDRAYEEYVETQEPTYF